MIPAAIALAVFILYALLFKDTRKKLTAEAEAERGLAASPVT